MGGYLKGRTFRAVIGPTTVRSSAWHTEVGKTFLTHHLNQLSRDIRIRCSVRLRGVPARLECLLGFVWIALGSTPSQRMVRLSVSRTRSVARSSVSNTSRLGAPKSE